MPTKRATQKHRTRAALLQAAIQTFARDGFTARMGDIAAEAGVSHGTLFAHFHSQEELVREVVRAVGAEIAEASHRRLSESRGLDDLLSAMVESLTPYEDFVARLVEELHRLPTEAMDAWVAVRSVLSHHFSLALEREYDPAQRGRLPPVHILFNLWMGLLQYYLHDRALFAPGGPVLARRGGELCDHYLRLVHGAAGVEYTGKAMPDSGNREETEA